MIRFLLVCLLAFGWGTAAICYCAAAAAGRYSRMEDADEMEQMQQGRYNL